MRFLLSTCVLTVSLMMSLACCVDLKYLRYSAAFPVNARLIHLKLDLSSFVNLSLCL